MTASKLLKTASAALVAFGLVIALGSLEATAGPLRLLASIILFDESEPLVESADAHLLSGILGGVLVGWGLTYWILIDRLLPKDPDLVKAMIIVPIVAWFLVDSAGSIASGGWLNAVLNLGFLAAFLVPIHGMDSTEVLDRV